MKFTLEKDDLLTGFEGWAFLQVATSLPGYAFAEMLEMLYGYQLARVLDMPLDGAEWPFFHYDDEVRKLKFFLVECPPEVHVAPWEAGTKLLLVHGDLAGEVVQRICDEFCYPPAFDPADLLAAEHNSLLEELLSGLVVPSVIDLDAMPPSNRLRREMQNHLDHMIDHLERQLLHLSAIERMRLEWGSMKNNIAQ